MPAKRRRPVVEEIIETVPERKVPEKIQVEHEHQPHRHVRVEEEIPVETQQQVAAYDEPPLLERVPDTKHAEAAARVLLASDEPEKKGPNVKLLFLVTIITALIVGFIAGGVYVYVSGVSSNATVESTPTPFPEVMEMTPTAKPSPTPTIVPSSYSVSVLNGSGVIGAAGKVKASLEAGGFKVTGTGNATNYSFKNTVIQAKESVPPAAIELLKKSLKDYVVEEGNALPASSTFDIIVTAGKE
jgi:hypothetical protein